MEWSWGQAISEFQIVSVCQTLESFWRLHHIFLFLLLNSLGGRLGMQSACE